MPYFILDLIQQVPIVEVPNLGRFEAVLDPAVIDIHRAQAYPPQLRTRFHPGEIEDAQLLAAYMQYASGMELTDARQAIDDFVIQVHQKSKDLGTYSISGFGTFTYSGDDALRFTPDWDAFNVSFNGLKSFHIPVTVEEEVTEQEVTFAESPQENYSGLSDTRPSDDSESNVPVPPYDVTEPQTTTSPPHDLHETVENENDSVSVNLWWGILISALLLISFLCAYLAYDIITNRDRVPSFLDEPVVNTEIDTQTNHNSEDAEIIKADTGTSDPNHNNTDEETQQLSQPIFDSSLCYIIVGAFSDIDNIIRMEESLAKAGMKSVRLPGANFTRIGIPTSCDPAEKMQTLEKAKSEITPQAWIY